MKTMTLLDLHHPLVRERARAALWTLFAGDALAMPVHWFYNPNDILRAFPGGIRRFENAPEHHPSSIMALHSTRQGGRTSAERAPAREIVGTVILKGRAHLWGRQGVHYHHGMRAGENTLNAHCARLLMRQLVADNHRYDRDRFLQAYIDFMTADPPPHPDTYAESYHRGFFANLVAGHPPHRCGARTHDTPSMGGLVTIGPLALHALLQGEELERVQLLCRQHLATTHPDEMLARVCDSFVRLIASLLLRPEGADPRRELALAARDPLHIDLEALVKGARKDRDVVGGRYSTACYIVDSWPCLLYLAHVYGENLREGLLANTNLGGENCHRGAVLGVLLGLMSGQADREWSAELKDREAIGKEIDALLAAPGLP